MSQRLDHSPSRHAHSAISEFVQRGEEPWTCWHTRLPWSVIVQSQPSNIPSTSPTVSSESSVQNEDELCARVDLLSLKSALSYFPETPASFGQCLEGFGQDFAGSSATDVTYCLNRPSRDIGHATRSEVSPFAESLGGICGSEGAVTVAAPEVLYLACPFSKHDPTRYELVWNVCTTRPGWKGVKRVLEHLHKVHSRKKRCERCLTQYSKQNQLKTHIAKNDCTKVEETDPSRPELMTAEQEEIFDRAFDAMTSEDKWRAYYQFLFPDAPNDHSIDPCYNYTTLTHRLDPLAVSPARADTLAPEVRCLACPFSKHDPARYERVCNSCTIKPGWEGVKRVLEHLRKVHSRDKRCARCRTRYPQEHQLDIHISKNNCAEVEETDPSRPELMTAEQEEIFDRAFDAMTSEDKWRAYYRFLFPDAPNHHSINPYYNYTTLTHRLDFFAPDLTTQKRPASPPSNPDDSPQFKRQSRRVPAATLQVDSLIARSLDSSSPYYCSRSGDGEIPFLNQNSGVREIGTSKFADDGSQSTNLDSTYGSQHGPIPSSSNPSAPMLSTSAPPKFDRDDSAIASSSNASVLTSPLAMQLQAGHALQDDSNTIPPPYYYPSNRDPDLPSNAISEEQKSDWGFDLEGVLDPNLAGSLDNLDQNEKLLRM